MPNLPHSKLLAASPDMDIQDLGSARRRPCAIGGTAMLSAMLLGGFAWLAARPVAAVVAPRTRTVAILDLTEGSPALPPGPAPASSPAKSGPPDPAPSPAPTPAQESTQLPSQEQVPDATPTHLPTAPATPTVSGAGSGHGGQASGGFGTGHGTPGAHGGGGGAGGTGNSGALPPRFDADYLNNPAPRYPAKARRFREEGKVMLRVLVSPEGAPMRVELRASSGFSSLDQEALATVQRWRFQPARMGAENVSAWVLVPIVFTLRG